LRIHNKTDTRPQLGEEEIEEVKEFVYLGSVTSKRDGSDEDRTQRIKKAKATFSQLSPIWKSKQISLNTKIRLFNTNVKSVLLDGCKKKVKQSRYTPWRRLGGEEV
jgi:hypothetical protein